MSYRKLISLFLGIIVFCSVTLIHTFADDVAENGPAMYDASQDDTGASITGKVTSYNPAVSCTVQLLQAGKVKYSVETIPGIGAGFSEQDFTIIGVANGTYDLLITKPGHLSYSITGIVVSGIDIDLSSNSNELISNITLVAGDINGDGCVDLKDVVIITSDANYGKSPVEAVYEDDSFLVDFIYETTNEGIIITGVKDKTKTEYTIPDGVIGIGDSAFEGCTNLTTITLPDSVTSISSRAFAGCSSLTTATVYATNATFGDDVFANVSTDFTIYSDAGSTAETYANENGHTFVVLREIVDSGTCGDNLTWTLYDDGELIIKGEGAMKNYASKYDSALQQYITTAPWGKHAKLLTKLTLDEGVTTIGDRAFYGCTKLSGDLVIPSGVTSIGDYSFYNCSSFTGNLTIGNSVTEIGDYAFYKCSGFTGDLVIPDSVTSIGNDAFYGCSGFTGKLVIGDSVTSIGQYAFQSCSGFTGSLTIGNSVTSIGSGAFLSCYGFTGDLVIPNSVTSIGDSAFFKCSGFTGDLVIPDSVTSISSQAFIYCSGFTGDLVIGNSVTSIGSGAFRECSGFMGDLVIPDSVTSIGRYAFQSCSGFTDELVIPDSVTSIGQYAFYGCTDLTKVTVYAVNVGFGSNAFGNTSSDLVLYGYLYSTTEAYASANGHNFVEILETEIKDSGSCGKNLTWTLYTNGELVIEGEGNMLDYNASDNTAPWDKHENNVTKLTLAEGISSIGSYAFYYYTFRNNLVIPDSVTEIRDYAFYRCDGLTGELIIPDSVTWIRNSAFYGCTDLTKVTIYAVNVGFGSNVFRITSSDFEIHGYAGSTAEAYANENGHKFVEILEIETKDSGTCGDDLTWTLYTNGELAIEGEGAMWDYNASDNTSPWYKHRNNVTRLTLAEGITTIGDYAFFGCNILKNNLVIPNSVTSIGSSAFFLCSGFTGELVIPDSVTSIGGFAFSYCSGFTGSLTIGYNVTEIGSNAFYLCNGLTGDLVIHNSVSTIGDYAFFGCNLKKAIIYATNTKLGSSVFLSRLEIHGYAGSTAEIYANENGHKFVVIS